MGAIIEKLGVSTNLCAAPAGLLVATPDGVYLWPGVALAKRRCCGYEPESEEEIDRALAAYLEPKISVDFFIAGFAKALAALNAGRATDAQAISITCTPCRSATRVIASPRQSAYQRRILARYTPRERVYWDQLRNLRPPQEFPTLEFAAQSDEGGFVFDKNGAPYPPPVWKFPAELISAFGIAEPDPRPLLPVISRPEPPETASRNDERR